MNIHASQKDMRVALFVDCDNVSPDVLDHALLMAARFGRVVMRRGYGNRTTLGNRWQEAMMRLAFTPCLQFQYVAGKNTSDIALALDAFEAHVDGRADTFCLVTSDSDFAYLCRKLRERGATVCVVGEERTPDALRHASDHFFEWSNPGAAAEPAVTAPTGVAPTASAAARTEAPKAIAVKPQPKRRPRSVIEAVSLLAGDAADGKVSLSALGNYLKRTDPAFSPKTYGHSGLLDMLQTYDLLKTEQDAGHWSVHPSVPGPARDTAV